MAAPSFLNHPYGILVVFQTNEFGVPQVVGTIVIDETWLQTELTKVMGASAQDIAAIYQALSRSGTLETSRQAAEVAASSPMTSAEEQALPELGGRAILRHISEISPTVRC
jgi:hypothetical protein